MPLLTQVSAAWSHIQGNLFPWLQAEAGPLTDNHNRLITVLELVRIEAFVAMPDSAGAAAGGSPGAARRSSPRRC